MSRKRKGNGQQRVAARPQGGSQTGKPASRGQNSGRRRAGKRRGLTWALLAAGTFLVLGSVRALSGGSGPDAGIPREGAPAPSLKLKTLEGDHMSLAGLRGKVVLVNFWATWCPPCRAEMPGFEHVWRERQRDGFVVLGLSADDGPGQVASFTEERGITYPVGMASQSAKNSFGGVTALPASFLIDKHGVVRRTVTGVFDERLLRQDVNRLLRED